MPTETRHISFRPHEIVAAIGDFHARRKLPIPKGKVLGISFTEAPNIQTTLSIRPDDEAEPVDFTLTSETLAAALVFYCINRSIPLPAMATKRLQRNGDEIALVITRASRS
ncbi:hypothetical protein D3874_00735 [Oleomonas cavernae]|uniref:Uncharacterized protein n=1 Tax=Oleomonas cavernae TaxID=2320859 RepID=A0A418WTB5_9PROT|nr:hypothetical protein [Oleomonas cavernae]RJF94409.1 hypothetical protein D3874_00735 [Oleomonas cavernae]